MGRGRDGFLIPVEQEYAVCDITRGLIDRLKESDAKGISEYGSTVDRTDLPFSEWVDHATDELLDAAKYLQAAKREYEQLQAENAELKAQVQAWVEADYARGEKH